jgi:hypothetical protein
MATTRTGPVTRAADTVPIGLAKVLVNPDWKTYFETRGAALNETTDSLGALNSSSFNSEVDFWRLESGFPAFEDVVVPLRERASFELEFKEVHPRNMALARGDDPTGLDDNHSGEITLGTLSTPENVRMEAVYTYPDKVHKMLFIFPRAQISSSASISFAQEDNSNVPMTIEARRADSETQEVLDAIDDGDITDGTVWDDAPLGVIQFS